MPQCYPGILHQSEVYLLDAAEEDDGEGAHNYYDADGI